MAKAETEVQNYIHEAQRRLRSANGEYVPAPRRQFVFEDAGVKVTLLGEGLEKPRAIYEGPLGYWQAGLTLRGPGKPRRWTPTLMGGSNA